MSITRLRSWGSRLSMRWISASGRIRSVRRLRTPGKRRDSSDVEGQVSDAVAEGQQGLDGGKNTVAAGGGQCVEGIREGLEIGQGDRRERLASPAAEAGDVGLAGALGVDGAAVEPDGDQLNRRNGPAGGPALPGELPGGGCPASPAWNGCPTRRRAPAWACRRVSAMTRWPMF